MTNRSGSFPLMALAKQYDLAYGDVLKVAFLRRAARPAMGAGWLEEARKARRRIEREVGSDAYHQMDRIAAART